MIEVNVNFKISLSEDTAALLSALLGANAKPLNAPAQTTETKKEAKPAKAKEEKPTPVDAGNAPVDLEMIRIKVVAHNRDEVKRAKVVDLYKEYGIMKVGELNKEDYQEFYAKLSAIG